MSRRVSGVWLRSAMGSMLAASAIACRKAPADPAASAAPATTVAIPQQPLEQRGQDAPQALATEPAQTIVVPPKCSPADWSPRALGPLLGPGKKVKEGRQDRAGSAQLRLAPQCGDAPAGAGTRTPTAVMQDGVVIELVGETDSGKSGRGWSGYQCAFEVRFADSAGVPTRLGPEQIPPFTNITALLRSGSAAWLSVTFNGYTKAFPKGGNRIIALDLCEGRVVWQSKDSMSNGGLLLLDDYLISPYGFTSERRYVYVLDAHSGKVIQKLPVIENICPSKSWAPNWKPGDRCDAPGQSVGAANLPRVDGGVFLIDTNTGSSSFQFL